VARRFFYTPAIFSKASRVNTKPAKRCTWTNSHEGVSEPSVIRSPHCGTGTIRVPLGCGYHMEAGATADRHVLPPSGRASWPGALKVKRGERSCELDARSNVLVFFFCCTGRPPPLCAKHGSKLHKGSACV